MTTQKKKRQKNIIRTKFFKAFAAVLVIGAACVLVAVSVHYAPRTQSYETALNKTSDDLHELYSKLINDLSVDSTTASFWKRCGQSSAKYNSGTITCGPRGEFEQNTGYETARVGNYTENVLKEYDRFVNVKVDNFDSDNKKWTAIDFVHADTGIECFVDLIDSGSSTTKYTLGCNEVVPDFLPGYTIEK